MPNTPIYALPEWGAAQASPWLTENQTKRSLEAVARGSVLDRDLAAPPGTCADGACYLIAAAPTGAWAGQTGKLAVAVGINAASGWLFATIATPGQLLWIEDEAVRIEYLAGSWQLFGTGTIDALSWKAVVRAASTVNGALATAYANGQMLDGVTLATGERILLKNQTAGAENGIYTVNASGAPTRSSDANTGAELVNAAAAVSEGTVGADKVFICTTNAPITPGTTALVFAELGAGGGLPAASTAEQLNGTEAAKAATPDSVAALWEQGSDVASAAILALGEGGYFAITGTTTISDIDFATDKPGRRAWLKFAGILTLTNSASLILPTGANIATAAGDCAEFVSEGADVVRCVAYTRANGQPLAANGAGLPFEMVVAASDETTALTAGIAKVTFRMPRAVTLTAVRASLTTPQTSGTIFTVDVNEAGVSVLSTKITIDNTEKTSTTAVAAPVISDSALADDAEMTIDIDQVGDGTAKGLKVTLIGTRT